MNQHILITVALLLVACHIEAACKGYPSHATEKTLDFHCDNVDISALNGFPNDTRSIYLENVPIEFLKENRLSRFTKLDAFSCKSCGIKMVDYFAFSVTPKLRYLGLGDNHIKWISGDWFGNSTVLEEVSIPHNDFVRIHSNFFEKVTKLKVLNVAYSQLQCLNYEGLSLLKDLIEIDARGRSLDGDCEEKLKEYAEEKKIELLLDPAITFFCNLLGISC